MTSGTLISYGNKLSREDLAHIPTPPATATHRPVPHHEIIQALVETLGFRHIGVVQDEYAVSSSGMKMFGVLDLETQFEGCRFSIGVRNAHDRSMRLALTVGSHSSLRKYGLSRGLHSGAGEAFTFLQPA